MCAMQGYLILSECEVSNTPAMQVYSRSLRFASFQNELHPSINDRRQNVIRFRKGTLGGLYTETDKLSVLSNFRGPSSVWPLGWGFHSWSFQSALDMGKGPQGQNASSFNFKELAFGISHLNSSHQGWCFQWEKIHKISKNLFRSAQHQQWHTRKYKK